jgi:hypothetical protein
MEPFWKVKLSPRSARYYKRRELARLSIFGYEKYQLQLETFEQVAGDWILTLSWQAPKKPIMLRGEKSGLQKDPIWVGESLAFVPQLRSFFMTNMTALSRASTGAGSFLFDMPITTEVDDDNN